MNCWKTVSITQDIGRFRLWILSGMMMLFYFLLYFLVFKTFITEVPLVDYGAPVLILCLGAVIPLHMVLHCIPVWMLGKKAIMGIRMNEWPFLYFAVKQPLPKRVSILAICSPAVFITAGAIMVSILFPHLLHYAALMSAFNIGICMHDFLYFKHIRKAPRHSFVEEYNDGFHILCENPALTDKKAS
ncbi:MULTISPECIES: DUF3267 domain-containing protein [Alteribacter]|uniref:DUF3267 domain-containing protein n=1 Tax=Alteribacter keqinensis TaxID=2483800 RepID=A0A3M7TSU6_9BACI|nr:MULTISPECIES: DUF3267 domain-containing protein [Alteribacter]MBM7097780.1 DUF3267 domain-containing protein [Alteribacter salitolerans]RNA68710.1 DUF3267 domain-containing protein [Alteribacter keqinensis]